MPSKEYYHQHKDRFEEYRKRFKEKHPNYWRRYKHKKDAYMKEYLKQPEVKANLTLYKERFILNGKRIQQGSQKRDRPNNVCEVCDGKYSRLEYHHWDDNDPSKGVWVCHLCHQLAEGIDKGLAPEYLKLKRLVSKER